MKKIIITQKVKQSSGYSASIPIAFPSSEMFNIPQNLINKAAEAERLIGKLDGATQTIPDVDFFLKMFALKDATNSAQIEGTQATMTDALELASGIESGDTDADDIVHYLEALNYGIDRSKEFPMSLRFIREIHKILMQNARATHFSDPGEFKKSQNWIGGTKPSNATFVPVPPEEMMPCLSDLEKFIYNTDSTLPIISIAYIHAQFETIHPFLDGNGRAGRLLVTLLLMKKKLLENPVLFLSSYFKKHKQVYYAKLDAYHSGSVFDWLNFFIEGVIETAEESIQTSFDIRKIRDEDMQKIQALGKRESETSVIILNDLFQNPIATTKTIMKITGFTRVGAQKAVDRLVSLDILEKQSQEKKYDVKYIYKRYLDCFYLS